MLIKKLHGRTKDFAEAVYTNSADTLDRAMTMGADDDQCDRWNISQTEWRDAIYTALTEKKAVGLCIARKLLNMSQIEISVALGISSQQISNFESGRCNITRSMELAIECLLHRSLQYPEYCEIVLKNPRKMMA